LISIFLFIFRKQVQDTKKDAERDGVTVPTTLQEYCVSVKPKPLDDVDNTTAGCLILKPSFFKR
jgi:hypothetical protein